MNPIVKKLIKPFYLFLLCIGFDSRQALSFRYYGKYRTQFKQFKKLGGIITHKYPIFTDYNDQAGSASGHYFHQDLLVATYVNINKPTRHIDIGSRIDGFIAHVASFRSIDVMDVRDLKGTGHCNISFIKADLMNKINAQCSITDSLSCLHAIEHFGLGRYGDQVDPNGHIKGFNNMIRMLKLGGTLYISFPIGISNEVHFNAHRVFHPKDIFTWAEQKNSLKLEVFDYVDDAGNLHRNIDIENTILNVRYGCGIYTFKKMC